MWSTSRGGRCNYLTAEGNPRGIRNFCDLARHDVRIVNRERGSGTRQVLDEALSASQPEAEANSWLPKMRFRATSRLRRRCTVQTQTSVWRSELPRRPTDSVSSRCAKSGTILAIPETELESAPVSRMLDALNSRRFAREVAQLCAYDTTRMGEELARIES